LIFWITMIINFHTHIDTQWGVSCNF
jgi:hypothetical protein